VFSCPVQAHRSFRSGRCCRHWLLIPAVVSSETEELAVRTGTAAACVQGALVASSSLSAAKQARTQRPGECRFECGSIGLGDLAGVVGGMLRRGREEAAFPGRRRMVRGDSELVRPAQPDFFWLSVCVGVQQDVHASG